MIDSIKNFLTNSELLKINPFESEKLIIIFDGLDELAMQGKTISESANGFIREIQRQVTTFNTTKLKLQVLISGRDIIIQQNENEFRKEKQIFRLLPYFLDERERKNIEPFKDSKRLLNIDQRDIWWKKYGKLKGGNYLSLPAELKKEELDDITSQPLLNYLIALSYERGAIDFHNETNLNTIYEDLLLGVFNRAYDGEDNTHRSLSNIDLEDFKRILEEIGLSTWHGDGRKTTVSEIQSHFKESGLIKLLNDFTKDAEKGVVSLLASFYFKKSSESNTGDETFEFTHKSFGEYLTATRILAFVDRVHENYSKNIEHKYSEEGWSIQESLFRWIKIFSIKEIDRDLHKFIDNGIQLIYQKDKSKLEGYQQVINTFMNYVLTNGLPLEMFSSRESTFIENKLSINAEKALLILHGTISQYTNIVSTIEVANNASFGEWSSRLLGQRKTGDEFIMNYFNNLDLSSSILYIKDFYEINLRNTNLSSAMLSHSNFIGATMININFEFAYLQGANFKRANLRNSNLKEAQLVETNFRAANLRGSNLSDAVFGNDNEFTSGIHTSKSSDLSEANLIETDFSDAKLVGVNLRNADCKKADFTRADLRNADLSGANFKGADLSEANLTGAIFKKSDLRGSKLEKTIGV